MNTFYAAYLALNLACPYPSVVSRTKRPWDDVDYMVMYQQTLKCQKMGFGYIDTIVRQDKYGYGIICGYIKFCLQKEKDR